MAIRAGPRLRGGLSVLAVLALSSFAPTVFALDAEAAATTTLAPAEVHETLVLDEMPSVTQPPAWYNFRGPSDLRRRAEDSSMTGSASDDGDKDKGDDSSSAAAKHSSETSASDGKKASSTAHLSVRTSSSATAAASQSPLPVPFDGVAASGFQSPGASDGCPTFMKNLLESADFQNCYPLSMMLQTSTSFFDAEKEVSSIVRVLDATCDVQSTQCASYLSKAAANLTTDANCKFEYDNQQSNVIQAYNGLVAYKVLYDATCLQDPAQDMYCFAEAVTNVSTVSDNYLYFLPFGMALPGASTPSCNWCTRHTMSLYHAATADHKDPLYKVYPAAASQVNTICGVNYVNTTVQSEDQSGALRSNPSYTIQGTVLAAVILSMFI